jgi:thiol-disulfide isomerase/thioredoxin
MSRLLAGGAVMALLLANLGVNVAWMAEHWDTIRPVTSGHAAPAFTLESLEGRRVSLRGLRGKVALVSFWATWCPPCLRELPLLSRLQRELGAEGLVVLAVNVEGSAEKARVAERKGGKGLTVLLDDGSVAEAYGAMNLPHLVLVDRRGQVAYIHVGAPREQKLEYRVRRALGLPPKEPTGTRGTRSGRSPRSR